ncbi:MAG: hypothetical protein NTX61_00975 [Bacteroidetes bacterium]|nr:hypothetical protein [Bacteroidota bacterium]
MKTRFILKKIFLLSFGLIVFLSLTTCDLTKKDDTQTDEHCTSTNSVTREFEMNASNFQYTYYVVKDGDFMTLTYFSDRYASICPKKMIQVGIYCYLLMNQSKPVQVSAKLFWHNDVNKEEVTLVKENDYLNNEYHYRFGGTMIDLSSYYLTGGDADIKYEVDFKFFSSGDVTADENYLKSVLTLLHWYVIYYPY